VSSRLTRRELAALLGGAALSGAASPVSSRFPVRHPGLVAVAQLAPGEGGGIDPTAARKAVASALAAATGTAEAGAAVRALFRPTDVVGIKLNCLGGRRMSPHPEVVNALVEVLVAGGIDPGRIILFERSSRELEGAGFAIRRSGDGPLCFGTDNDYEPRPTVSGEIGSCYARLVTETCTALVGFGVVKDHDLAGVSGSLKNWYGVIHNPNKYHDNQCDPYVADVVRHPHVADKLRLTVLDGVTAQCHGGPAYRPDGVFDLHRLAVSTDPVAADLWAWRVLDVERVRRGLPTLEAAGRPPRFIATAAGYGLGIGVPAALEEVEA
jgi:uncharacterized protein (DUF362 family)